MLQMFITITIEADGSSADIRIDSEQRICTCVQVLRESGKMPSGESPAYFRSEQNERLVSSYKTFSDEGIYDGDMLTAIA